MKSANAKVVIYSIIKNIKLKKHSYRPKNFMLVSILHMIQAITCNLCSKNKKGQSPSPLLFSTIPTLQNYKKINYYDYMIRPTHLASV